MRAENGTKETAEGIHRRGAEFAETAPELSVLPPGYGEWRLVQLGSSGSAVQQPAFPGLPNHLCHFILRATP